MLAAGDAYFAPRGIPHRIRNTGLEPVRSLVVSTPGTFATFIKRAAIRKDAEGAYPLPSSDYVHYVSAAARKSGIEMLAPPEPAGG